MTTNRYVNVKSFKTGVRRDNGNRRDCLHGGRTATITAVRIRNRFRMWVPFCEEHAREGGAIT